MVTLRRRLRIAVLGIKQLPATGGADRAVEKLLEHGSQSHEYFVYVKRQPAQPSLGGQNVHYVPIPTVGGKPIRSMTVVIQREVRDVAALHKNAGVSPISVDVHPGHQAVRDLAASFTRLGDAYFQSATGQPLKGRPEQQVRECAPGLE